MKSFTVLFVFISFMLTANPKGLNVKQGACEVKDNTKNMQIDCSDKTILEWNDFSIKLDEKVNFTLPCENASVLNKVVEDVPSEILGSLDCNGKLYLINPSGILFGKDSVVNCKELIASTLKINEEEFLKDKSITFENVMDSKITHLGYIKGKGNIYLLSKQINAKGLIETDKTVTLAAANKLILQKDENIFIELSSEDILEKCLCGIEQNGKISAAEVNLLADGNLYDISIAQSGIIDANTTFEADGKVFLSADNGDAHVKGIITVKGNDEAEINITAKNVGIIEGAKLAATNENGGGDINIVATKGYAFLGKDIEVNADADLYGDGGNVFVYSDNVTFFHGSISAKGGALDGDGGFVEVSGASDLYFTGDVTTKAFNGLTGKLLIDPTDITINNSATTPPSFAFPPAQSLFTRPGPTATLNAADLVSQLQNNNVVVNTTPGVGGPNGGRIVVDAAVQWNNGFNLTLTADENIIVNADIISGIGGSLTFNAAGNVSFRGINNGVNVFARGGDVNIQAGNSIILSALDNFIDVKSLGGNIDADAGNNITISGSSTDVNGRAILGNQVFQGTFGNITVDATNNININGGDVTGTNAGIRTNDGGGDVSITCNAMNINGGSASGSDAVVFSTRDIIVDTGSALNLTAGTVGESRIFSDAGSVTVDVGTGVGANLTLLGNSTSGTAISADSTVNVTSSQTISATNSIIISRSENATIDAVNQINLIDSEFQASNTLTIQNANLLTLDNSSAIGLDAIAINIPTVDLSNDALLRGDTANISGNNLTVDASAIRAPNGELTLGFNSVTLSDSARVFSGGNFILNGRNLSLDNDSTILSDSGITITQTGIANDVQVLGTISRSAVRSTGDLTISTDTFLVDNSALESFSQNIDITTNVNTTLQNDSFMRSRLNTSFTVGGDFLLDNSNIVSKSADFTSSVTGTQTIQNSARLEIQNNIDLQALALTLNASDIESISGGITYNITNAFDIENGSLVRSSGEINGTSTDFTVDNSTLNSTNGNAVISANSINVLNGGVVTATDLNCTATTTLSLNNANVDVATWIVNAPILGLTGSLIQTEVVQFNISALNLTNSQLFIEGSLIEQP